jgi:type II secretory pathway component PulF
MPNQYFDSDPLIALLQLALLLLGFIVTLAIEWGIIYALYFLITLPMRRNERTRLFLDLLGLGLKDGQTPENAIVSAASSNDPAMGVRFHLLAAHLQNGLRLSAALQRVSRLLPAQIVAMLNTGERIGDIKKVLPACRRLTGDGVSQVRGALNYVLILGLVVSPTALVLAAMLNLLVVPKFKEVFEGMLESSSLPAFTRAVLGGHTIIFVAQVSVILVVWFLTFAYLGGPRVSRWFRFLLPGVPDWVQFHLPWRRKRLQRDFSAMLAILLDAHVPESEAVQLAAESTANRIIQRRAGKIRARLAQGARLPDAIRALDDTGELHWRLSNALQRGRNFLGALNGWHEALDSKAFQQEQAAAQITTTALVLFNGFIIAAVVIGMFLPLIALINSMALW